MKRLYWMIVLAVALCAIPATEAEAQVPVYDTNGNVVYGVPAQPGPVANGTVRHDYNGYRGVNPRHYSRVAMRHGTGPIMATGPIVAYRPYATYGCAGRYPVHYGGAYIARRPFGGGFVHGGAVVHPVGGPRGYVSVGVSGPGYAVGGTVGW